MAAETAVVLAVQLTCTVLRYIGAICLARAVGTAWYGSFTLATTLVVLGGMISTMGVTPGVLPMLSRARRAGPERLASVVRAAWTLVLSIGLPAAVTVALVGPLLATHLFHDQGLAALLPALGVYVLLAATSHASAGLVQGLFGAHRQALVEPLLPVAVSVSALACAWAFGWGVPGAAAATLAGPLVGALVGTSWVLRVVPGALRPGTTAPRMPLRELFRDSWPLMGVSTLAFVLGWMDVLLMGVFRTPAEVGVYGACARLAFTVVLLHEAAGPVFLARLSALFVERDWDAIGHMYRATARWSAWAGATVAGVLLIWRREVVGLFGPEFVSGTGVLVVLVAGRLLATSVGLCGRVLAVTGKARLSMVNALLMIGCNGLLDLYWIPEYGGTGAAAATCVAVALVKTLQSAQVWVFYRVHPFTWRGLAALPVLGALTGAVLWLDVGHGALWPLALAGFVLACGMLYLAVGADDEDRALVRRLVPRTPR